MRRLIVFALAALMIPSNASAATCGVWVTQTNGMSWRACVDDQGRKFCQLQSGRTIRLMRCP